MINFKRIYLQDRYVDVGSAEPQIDPSQDYSLMKGYENSTHTVLRFRRKLDTCDNKHDIVISVSITEAFYSCKTVCNIYVITFIEQHNAGNVYVL